MCGWAIRCSVRWNRGAYLAEDLIGTTKFNDRTSTAYAGSLLLTEMERFAGTSCGYARPKTIDLPDVGVEGQTAFPLHHGPSGTDTTGSELENTAYFPQGNTSRNAATSSPNHRAYMVDAYGI